MTDPDDYLTINAGPGDVEWLARRLFGDPGLVDLRFSGLGPGEVPMVHYDVTPECFAAVRKSAARTWQRVRRKARMARKRRRGWA